MHSLSSTSKKARACPITVSLSARSAVCDCRPWEDHKHVLFFFFFNGKASGLERECRRIQTKTIINFPGLYTLFSVVFKFSGSSRVSSAFHNSGNRHANQRWSWEPWSGRLFSTCSQRRHLPKPKDRQAQNPMRV